MADIIIINFRKIQDKWQLGVVRDNNYAEVTEKDISLIQDEFNKIFEFAQTVKSEEQRQIEEQEKREREMMKLLLSRLTEDDIIKNPFFLPEWAKHKNYLKGDYVRFDNIPYRCRKDHSSKNGYEPNYARLYWWNLMEIKPEEYNNDKEYQINDKVLHQGIVYSSLIVQQGKDPVTSDSTWEYEGEF